MTCRDCFKFSDCMEWESTKYYGLDACCNNVESVCEDFKNKADFVEVKHGYWITRKSIHKEEFYVCSACASATDDIWRYCPNCGAKMDGGNT